MEMSCEMIEIDEFLRQLVVFWGIYSNWRECGRGAKGQFGVLYLM